MSGRPPKLANLSEAELREVTTRTTSHDDSRAEGFWHGTREHDVSQNVDALLRNLPRSRKDGPQTVLDFGCGPGRDVATFRDAGHRAIGLDGAAEFVQMARKHTGCEVLHQDFLQLDLGSERFHGIFANASLFHVPSQALPRVLGELWTSLVPGGALFSSNPRGPNSEGWSGERYCCHLDIDQWRAYMHAARFTEIEHYYRPPGKPREHQPWLASVWRKPERVD